MELPDKPLFFYGTLRDLDVLEVVLGRRVPQDRLEPAWLPGHEVARVPDESYPVLVVADNGSAPGVLYDVLDPAELDRILFFESFEYAPREKRVIAEHRGDVAAQVFAEAQMLPGAAERWSLTEWQQRHKPRFLDMTRRFMELCGRASLEEAEALWEQLENEPDRPAARRSAG